MAEERAPDARRRPPRPFIVPVAALRKTAGTVRHETREGSIEGMAAVGVSGARSPGSARCPADLTLSSYPDGIMVTGTVGAPWVGECRRCGGPVSGTVEAEVRERYVPRPGVPVPTRTPICSTGDELGPPSPWPVTR